jgi:glycosyltransferase involved in cell wall biosynthesis
MSKPPLVTVVIPTYNRRHCLGRAIDSVLRQDCGPVELIVVDDASPDGSADWMATAYPHIKLIRNPANRGVSASRNAGLAAGGGQFIAFLDDDDWWDEAFLRRHLDLLASRPDAVLSHCDYTSVAPDGGSPKARNSREVGTDPVKTFLMENPIQSLTLAVMRRQALAEERGFREDYAMCEDREMYLRLLRHGAFVHEPRPLAYKTRSTDSVTLNLAHWATWAQNLLDDFFSREESRPYRHLEKQARARWKTRTALMCLRRAGSRRLGLRLAASALKLDARDAARYLVNRLWLETYGQENHGPTS